VDSPLLNAVRVTARRTRERGNPAGTYFARLFGLPQADVSAAATAVLDRHVVGFRPAGRIPVPLAPLALLSDPDKPRSWESQVEKPLAQPEPRPGDRFRYDRAGRRFLAVPGEAPVGDGLCEMEVRLPLEGQALDLDDADEANACLLQIGEPAWDVLCRQLAGGVTATDLANRAGQLRLETDAHYPQPRLFLPGSQLGPAAGSAELTQVLGALQTLRQTAEPRIWPLFHERHADGVEGQGTVVVVGFVAARVVQAQLAAEGTGPDQRTQLALILQPCQAVANAALTDAAAAINPYVSKPRLTE
jgi:hypothetical protein